MLPQRKFIRLKYYDYSQNGYYFITICADRRQPLFWNTVPDNRTHTVDTVGADDPVRPCNTASRCCTNNTNQYDIDMSANRLSPIGEIVEKCWNNINKIYPNVRTDYYVIMPDHFHGIIVINDKCADGQGRPSLPKIVQSFKSVTTRMCFQYGYRKIWQTNYYEHIIRDDNDYIQTVEYIVNNPLKWGLTQNE